MFASCHLLSELLISFGLQCSTDKFRLWKGARERNQEERIRRENQRDNFVDWWSLELDSELIVKINSGHIKPCLELLVVYWSKHLRVFIVMFSCFLVIFHSKHIFGRHYIEELEVIKLILPILCKDCSFHVKILVTQALRQNSSSEILYNEALSLYSRT